jgi:hypothetical protein
MKICRLKIWTSLPRRLAARAAAGEREWPRKRRTKMQLTGTKERDLIFYPRTSDLENVNVTQGTSISFDGRFFYGE